MHDIWRVKVKQEPLFLLQCWCRAAGTKAAHVLCCRSMGSAFGHGAAARLPTPADPIALLLLLPSPQAHIQLHSKGIRHKGRQTQVPVFPQSLLFSVYLLPR